MAEKVTKRRRPGRPPQSPEKAKTFPLSFRTSEERHHRVAKAAARNGRSIAQELEYRLDQTFDDATAKIEHFGGVQTLNIMKILAAGVQAIEGQFDDRSWLEDPEVNQEVERTILGLLRVFAPKRGKAGEVDGLSSTATLSKYGTKAMASALETVAKNLRGERTLAQIEADTLKGIKMMQSHMRKG